MKDINILKVREEHSYVTL